MIDWLEDEPVTRVERKRVDRRNYMLSITPRQYILLSVVLLILLLYQHKPAKEIDWHATKCTWYKNTTWGCFDSKNFRLDLTTDVTGTLPYFSGANLVLFADYVFDHKVKNVARAIEKMRDGDTIYVKGDYTNMFFRHEFKDIKTKFIIMSHNSDASAHPRHAKYLDNDKVIAWFAENPAFEHPKLIPIPIAMENPFYFPEKIKIVRGTDLNALRIPWEKRKILLYINFSVKTNKKARQPLIDYFSKFDQVVINPKGLDYKTYLTHLGNSKFVLCPRGNGLDTHRYFETILMGAIPVVENSTLWTVYRETTSFVISDLRLVTIDMLNSPDPYLTNRNFSRDIMMWNYWEKRINEARRIYRNDL